MMVLKMIVNCNYLNDITRSLTRFERVKNSVNQDTP